jgi:hypothetical protein
MRGTHIPNEATDVGPQTDPATYRICNSSWAIGVIWTVLARPQGPENAPLSNTAGRT